MHNYVQLKIPPRLYDFEGWKDIPEFEAVSSTRHLLNIKSDLRLFGSSQQPFRSVELDGLITPSQLKRGNGIITVRARDLRFDVQLTLDELRSPDFDHRKSLVRAALHRYIPHTFSGWDLTIGMDIPLEAGASLGISSSISVGLYRLLMALLGIKVSMRDTIMEPVYVETQDLKLLGGSQDQAAAASPWIATLITIGQWPETSIQYVRIHPSMYKFLNECVCHIFTGPHISSDTHKVARAQLTSFARLQEVSDSFHGITHQAKTALETGDVEMFIDAINRNTRAQLAFYPGLAGPDIRAIIHCAQQMGAHACKICGAGGVGGTVSAVFDSHDVAVAFYRVASQMFPSFTFLEGRLAA